MTAGEMKHSLEDVPDEYEMIIEFNDTKERCYAIGFKIDDSQSQAILTT